MLAEDGAANVDALQWKGVYWSAAEDALGIFGTRGVVSVTATSPDDNASVATGLLKDDSAYSKEAEDDEERYYAYNEEYEQD